MDATIECGHCRQPMAVDVALAGSKARCPSCGEVVAIPADLHCGFTVERPDEAIYCRKCGTRNAGNNYKCTQCGEVLHATSQPRYAISDDSSLGGLIPYRNPKALWSYYLGIAALFPMLGFPVGIAALILGIQGVKYARANPEAKGKIHAWVGIVLGGLSVLGHSIVIAGIISASLAQ